MVALPRRIPGNRFARDVLFEPDLPAQRSALVGRSFLVALAVADGHSGDVLLRDGPTQRPDVADRDGPVHRVDGVFELDGGGGGNVCGRPQTTPVCLCHHQRQLLDLADGAVCVRNFRPPFQLAVKKYKNLHIGDVNLFWKDIELNAKERIKAYLGAF